MFVSFNREGDVKILVLGSHFLLHHLTPCLKMNCAAVRQYIFDTGPIYIDHQLVYCRNPLLPDFVQVKYTDMQMFISFNREGDVRIQIVILEPVCHFLLIPFHTLLQI